MKFKKNKFILCIICAGISLMLLEYLNEIRYVYAKENSTESKNNIAEFEESLNQYTTGELISETKVYFKMESNDIKNKNSDGLLKSYTKEEFEKDLKD